METVTMRLHILILLCFGCCGISDALECFCSGCSGTKTCTVPSGTCYKSVDSTNPNARVVAGCLPKSLESFMCNQSDSSFHCCHGNHCNGVADKNQRTRFLREEVTNKPANMNDSTTIAIIVSTVLVLTILIVSLTIAVLCFYVYKKRRSSRRATVEQNLSPPEIRCSTHTFMNNCIAILPQSESIGSLLKEALFYGQPLSLLLQRSIAQQTALEKSVHKGSYSHHYIGRWREDRVNVKVYHSKYETLWFNETQILQLPLMRHDNILSFVAADTVIRKSLDYYYLISEHHPRGTLRDYLDKSTVEVRDVLTLVTSLVTGLEYLHSEVSCECSTGIVSKPSVAHCNLSSQNVYVDKSGSCCLSDFSLSVQKRYSRDLFKPSPHCDPRYLAPEFLTEELKEVELEALIRGDVYAAGLVMWEIAQCCILDDEDCGFSLAYSDLLTSGNETTPTREEMRKLVREQGKRPALPKQCNRDQHTRVILGAIEECWAPSPPDRPTSYHLKSTLDHSLASGTKYHVTIDKNGQPVYKRTTDMLSQ